MFEIVRVDVNAPEIFPASFNKVVPFLHLYVRPVPVAVTESTTVFPEQVTTGCGCEVMETFWFTTSAALFEVTGEHGEVPETTTL